MPASAIFVLVLGAILAYFSLGRARLYRDVTTRPADASIRRICGRTFWGCFRIS